MQLIISYLPDQVRKSITLLEDDVRSAPKGMSFRFPFDASMNRLQKESQLLLDERSFAPQELLPKLALVWDKKEREVVDRLERYCGKKGIALLPHYSCFLTFYGPYGFFVAPDTIFVDIAGGRSVDFLLHTFLHELLHIVCAAQTASLSYEACEQFVDQLFIDLWGDLFPSYERQNFPKKG